MYYKICPEYDELRVAYIVYGAKYRKVWRALFHGENEDTYDSKNQRQQKFTFLFHATS